MLISAFKRKFVKYLYKNCDNLLWGKMAGRILSTVLPPYYARPEFLNRIGSKGFVSPYADALLLLCVITSRNPQMLIGEQVRAAPMIKYYNLEAIGTAYMLIESGNNTSVHYMSNSMPIPHSKSDIAVAHALAGQYIGMKVVYLDAGSGAKYPVSNKMIAAIRKNVSLPIILGGGIKTPEVAAEKAIAGADFIVTGNVLEENCDPKLIREFADAIHNIKR